MNFDPQQASRHMAGVVNTAGQSLRAFSARIRTALAEAARVLKERIVAVYRRIIAFMLSLWALAIQLYKSAEQLLTDVYLAVRFPSIGVGLIVAGWRTGILWIGVVGVLYLVVLGVLMVCFRNSEPLGESKLALLWCRWLARLTLVGAMAVGMFLGFRTMSLGSWVEGTVEAVSHRLGELKTQPAEPQSDGADTTKPGFWSKSTPAPTRDENPGGVSSGRRTLGTPMTKRLVGAGGSHSGGRSTESPPPVKLHGGVRTAPRRPQAPQTHDPLRPIEGDDPLRGGG